MLLGLETFSYHLAFAYGKMDIFDFIKRTAEFELDGVEMVFLPRHGRGHVHLPSEIPNRANIYAFKTLGMTHVLGVSAVGIMKEHISPGDMIVPDQLFDRTRGQRASTFFGGGIVGHVMFADPVCPVLRDILIAYLKLLIVS